MSCSLLKETDMQDYFYHPYFISKPTNEFASTSSMKEKENIYQSDCYAISISKINATECII